ncbi:MAG: hypothetical protein ABI262_17130, partial [Microcoleus sp.]
FKEVYFKSLIKLENQLYADFLVDVFRFQEGFLRFLVATKLGFNLPERITETQGFWNKIERFDGGIIYKFLNQYRLNNGEQLKFGQGFASRILLMAILECYPQEFERLLEPLRQLNDYCEQRNRCVHSFEGVSDLQDGDKIVKILRDILRQKTAIPDNNSFNVLNSKICCLLAEFLQG